MTQTFKPTPDDIRAAITNAETGNWLDRSVTPICSSCDLYGPDAVHIGDGNADNAAAAAAMAWLSYCAPAALVDGYIDEDDDPVPLVVPGGHRFKLSAPAEIDADGTPFDPRPSAVLTVRERRISQGTTAHNRAERLEAAFEAILSGAAAGIHPSRLEDAAGEPANASQRLPRRSGSGTRDRGYHDPASRDHRACHQPPSRVRLSDEPSPTFSPPKQACGGQNANNDAGGSIVIITK